MDEDSDDGNGKVIGDYIGKDGSQMLVNSEILSQIRSSSLLVANDETLPSHRDSLLLCDPELCSDEEDTQEGTSYIILVGKSYYTSLFSRASNKGSLE